MKKHTLRVRGIYFTFFNRYKIYFAVRIGFEPITFELTARHSTIELPNSEGNLFGAGYEIRTRTTCLEGINANR